MNPTAQAAQELHAKLTALNPAGTTYASEFVDTLLASGREANASDIHLQPASDGLDVLWRLDGVLHSVGRFARGEAADIVARLKVLAELLTYRCDAPQEGRLRQQVPGTEIRVSTFPTLHGERAVVRMFVTSQRYLYLEDLGYPADILHLLTGAVAETGGAVIFSGPAGSGKTTSAYACVREILRSCHAAKCVMSLEDPIEVAVEGAVQSQVNEVAGFTLESGLRSLLRQDPEVILVGEIRDRATAQQVLQASVTGHLMLTTFHAGSAVEAVSRLANMDVEAYQLRSGVMAISCQRLVRTVCDCARETGHDADLLGLPVTRAKVAAGCDDCRQTGYRGRSVLAELLAIGGSGLARVDLAGADTATLESAAVAGGMIPLWKRACEAVERGVTTPHEVRRVLGFRTGIS